MTRFAVIGLTVFAVAGCSSEDSVVKGPDVTPDVVEDAAPLPDASTDTDTTAPEPDTSVKPDTEPADITPALVCPGQPGCPCEASDQCDDGDPCTADGPCENGACQGKSPTDCDDDNICTVDTCEGDCVHTPAPNSCEDGDPCTVGDSCEDGVCKAGKAPTCDDSNPCTDDSCTPQVGCTFMHNTDVCVDANACTAAGTCEFAKCVPGKVKPCGDSSVCTYSYCDPDVGCQHKPYHKASQCDGGVVVDGDCYRAFEQDKGIGWKDARESCAAWGGTLATIRSKQANSAARAQADATCGKGDTAWIGLNDRMREGYWRWGDNSAPIFLNWNKGEPNNSGDEDVVTLLGSGLWNDAREDPAKSKAPCWVCSRPMAVPCTVTGGACFEGASCKDGKCDNGAAKVDDCDDNNDCTGDSCAKGLCKHVTLPKGATCTLGSCSGSLCLAPKSAPKTAPTSCAAVLASNPKATSGVYWLQPAGLPQPVSAHCDMHTDGGGWTLALKTTGKDAAFGFDGEAWKSKPQGPSASPGPGNGDEMLATWWTVPSKEVRLVMLRKSKVRSVQLKLKGPSLHALVNAGKPVETSAGLPQWRQLLSDGSIQKHCHVEGVNMNIKGNVGKVRLGILGNNENDCGTPDSWIGVGGNDSICGGKKKVFAGNIACYGATSGNRSFAAQAWVYVR